MVDVVVYETAEFTDEDMMTIYRLRLSLPHYDIGEYVVGNMKIVIKKALN